MQKAATKKQAKPARKKGTDRKAETKKVTTVKPAEPLRLDPSKYTTEVVALSDLKPHPRNYRGHPEDQIAHLMESIRKHGFYRNIVVSKNNVILAGHGVTQAAAKLDIKQVPVVRLSVDENDPAALKILTGDNEIARLAEVDDESLVKLLNEINDIDVSGLLGTGFSAETLAGLRFVTKPPDQLTQNDPNSEWVGMPEFESGSAQLFKMAIQFRTKADRAKCCEILDLPDYPDKINFETTWPRKEREDLSSVKLEQH